MFDTEPCERGQRMSSAHRYLPNYTVDDYQRWEGDWELWQGIPVAMTPSPFGRHQAIAARLVTLLNNAVEQTRCNAIVMAEIDRIVTNHTVCRRAVRRCSAVTRRRPPRSSHL
jgi:Uma2 family endonuclease